MYGEDIDLSYRIVKAGYENWFLPTPMVHYKGESTHKDSMRYVRIFYDAMLIFYRKHFPRFNVIFYPIVKLGVIVRAGMAMAKRLLKRMLPFKEKPASEAWPWVIISDHAPEVAHRAGIGNYLDHIPSTGNHNVLIDDGSHTYAQTVDYIKAHSDGKRLAFHIFADRHGIIMTVGVYAVATGDNKRAQLQHTLMQAAAAHEHVEQVHGFYYFEDERRVSIDVVPDITIHNDAAFIEELRAELQPLVPDDTVTIVIDHNYSE
jgi:hypothetical protein